MENVKVQLRNTTFGYNHQGGVKRQPLARKERPRRCQGRLQHAAALQEPCPDHHRRQRAGVCAAQGDRQEIGHKGLFCAPLLLMGKGAYRGHK